ncbi:hypothetical protein [Rhodopirellula sallentina]|nr:hypothetical protein [Rhodopirellula sallentina]
MPAFKLRVGEAMLTSDWLITLVSVTDTNATLTVSSYDLGANLESPLENLVVRSTVAVDVNEFATLDASVPLRFQLMRLFPNAAWFGISIAKGHTFYRLETFKMLRRKTPREEFFAFEKMPAAERERIRSEGQQEISDILEKSKKPWGRP